MNFKSAALFSFLIFMLLLCLSILFYLPLKFLLDGSALIEILLSIGIIIALPLSILNYVRFRKVETYNHSNYNIKKTKLFKFGCVQQIIIIAQYSYFAGLVIFSPFLFLLMICTVGLLLIPLGGFMQILFSYFNYIPIESKSIVKLKDGNKIYIAYACLCLILIFIEADYFNYKHTYFIRYNQFLFDNGTDYLGDSDDGKSSYYRKIIGFVDHYVVWIKKSRFENSSEVYCKDIANKNIVVKYCGNF